MKKTKIVCTLGPSTDKEEILKSMIVSGFNVARLNFSHGSHDEQQGRIDMVKKLRKNENTPIAIMLDTKGPEIRTGDFENGVVELKEGQNFTITTRDILGNDQICAVTYKGLTDDVKVGDTILIDDGLVGLEVITKPNSTDILCVVKNAGVIKNKKGVNVPGVKINLPAITQKDVDDIEFGIKNDIDFIAASFIRKSADVLKIREILEANNASDIEIISKIENQEGVDNIDEIIEISDGIMVARGDLGVEIPAEDVPLVQKMIIKKCNKAGKPVITATQMLDSMIRNPRPTRAEVTDVANAILDGTDAIMLSGETAAGKYPIQAVETMSNIAKKIETTIDYERILKKKAYRTISVTNAISHATCTTALELGVAAIITATSSGYTARAVSKFRPKSQIIAATSSSKVRRKLCLVWGVESILIEESNSTDEIIENSVSNAVIKGYINNGDLVVITAGVPVGVSGSTNLVKIHTVGEIVFKGTGIGRSSAIGNVCKIQNIKDAEEKFEEGNVIVSIATDKDMVKYMEKAAAIITEKGGLTSHAAVVGLNLGIPVIVGADNALEKLQDGDLVTVDGNGGVVFKGAARIL
ncbi:pyruvate kinase [Abyssisolibacter fermentans]|uniref:pyruvate kinase n=1 Tax=Abyssisolibacter fermentans TaxID=1766203 RepID=UPI00082EB455|nr:pyruvate kinase [Abyssisolibacter fermentans]